MRFRKGRETEVTLGIAPLIDIVFLLLIFFMVTSHFDVGSGVRIQLPEVSTKVSDQEKKKANLIVDKLGQTYLEGERVDLETLPERLKRLVTEKGLLYLIIQADEETRHGRVVQIMDMAKMAGIRSILIAARWNPEQSF